MNYKVYAAYAEGKKKSEQEQQKLNAVLENDIANTAMECVELVNRTVAQMKDHSYYSVHEADYKMCLILNYVEPFFCCRTIRAEVDEDEKNIRKILKDFYDNADTTWKLFNNDQKRMYGKALYDLFEVAVEKDLTARAENILTILSDERYFGDMALKRPEKEVRQIISSIGRDEFLFGEDEILNGYLQDVINFANEGKYGKELFGAKIDYSTSYKQNSVTLGNKRVTKDVKGKLVSEIVKDN